MLLLVPQETFGAMAKTEKIAYILEQVRLGQAVHLLVLQDASGTSVLGLLTGSA